jgi:hypothetical protein
VKPTEFWTWSLQGEGGRRYRMRGKYTEATANSPEELQETHPGSWLNIPKTANKPTGPTVHSPAN